MATYYNEWDPYAAQWLRNLIAAGLIPEGDVDTRSIVDVHPIDLIGYEQVHFFAGIGGWAYAARLAGWPDDRPLWTGSCPCQPFSAAGKRKGDKDERHLWPEFRRLISVCDPAVVFGEQVASKDGRRWLAGVRADLEGMGYAVGAADLCAASVGAPHIRQRLWWVADAGTQRRERWPDTSGPAGQDACEWSEGLHNAQRSRLPRRMADADGGLAGNGHLQSSGEHGQQPQDGGSVRRMGDADQQRPQGRNERGHSADERSARATGMADFWSDSIWLPCTDGKARRVEPGTFPLAHGVSARVGRLRAYGNAISPQVAAEFIQAFGEAVTYVLPSAN